MDDERPPFDMAMGRPGLRVRSLLTAETEAVITGTIGAAIAVHRALGPGFMESAYRVPMGLELRAQGLSYEAERRLELSYRGVRLPRQRVDLIVEECVVVELKSVMRLDDIHRAQLISYLRATRLRAGLLINFRVPALRLGLRRVVL
jgi:GxxExxY protein